MVAVETFAPQEALPEAFTPTPSVAGWCFQRLSVDLPDERYVVEFHPALTVVAVDGERLGPLRDALNGALSDGPAGTHVELAVTPLGGVVVFRPHGGRHRVVSVADRSELDCDVLTALSPPAVPHGDAAIVAALAAVDQQELWEAADALGAARATASAEGAAGPRDDASHGGTSATAGRKPRFRILGRHRGQVADTPDALALAEQAWARCAAGVGLEEAIAHRPAVEAAVHVMERLRALKTMGAEGNERGPLEELSSVAAAVARVIPTADGDGPVVVTVLTADGDGADNGDAAVDEPVTGSLVLEALTESGQQRQVIVLTTDAATADWGRMEAHASGAQFVDLR